jgi:hypothetical protein
MLGWHVPTMINVWTKYEPMLGWHVPTMINVWTKYEPSLYGNGETDLITKTCSKFKSVDNENEVKVKWHMPIWHVSCMMNVWIKDGEPRLYSYGETDLITSTLRKFNQVSKPGECRWHMPGNHVHTMINVWTRYGEPSCMAMDLIMTTWHC